MWGRVRFRTLSQRKTRRVSDTNTTYDSLIELFISFQVDAVLGLDERSRNPVVVS